MNWSKTTKAKSDQMNADDLIGGPITITITNVKIIPNDVQSGVVSYEGDNGKPYKPCKSMRRVMELKWGSDETKFAGRSMTIERDPTVKWAGEEVGGIRITHMTDMQNDNRFMLTSSRGQKKACKIEHLVIKDKSEAAMEWVNSAKEAIGELSDQTEFEAWYKENAKIISSLNKYPEVFDEFDRVYNDAFSGLATESET